MGIGETPPDSGQRPVVVTGGAGFIGAAVCKRAATLGIPVVALVRSSVISLMSPDIEYVVVDWTDVAGLSGALRSLNPSTIVHCAGAAARGGESPTALYEANVCLVARLLESAVTSCPNASVVLLSSAAAYGPESPVPTGESAPLDPRTDYGTSKAMAEMLGRAFASRQGLRACIARPFNVLGPGEPSGSVVSAISEQLVAAPVGSTAQVVLREVVSIRDFVDIDDAAGALLAIGESGEAGEAYNVCTGVGVSIAELVEQAAHAWGRNAEVVVREPSLIGNVSLGSNDKLKALGWAPRHSLADTLARMAASQS